MKITIAVLLWLTLTSCSTFSSIPSVSVSIEDMEGVGNENLSECEISFDGDVSNHPCVVEVEFEWPLQGTGVL